MGFGIPVRNGISAAIGAYASMRSYGLPAYTLSQVFAGAAALDASITFTRTTVATYINAAGVITQAAINEPRFDYDPVTLAPLGLLIEEARTNLLWNCTLDGANLATQTRTVTAVQHVLSFYGTGTITLSGVSTAGPLVGSGAYPTRSYLVFTPTAGSLTLTVTGTVQFAQLETTSTGLPSSFIPSGGAAAARTADNATMTGADFTSWFNATEGTFVVSGDTLAVDTATKIFIEAASDLNNRMGVAKLVTSGFANYFSVVGGVTQASMSPANTLWTGITTLAAAYKANDFACAVNTSAVLLDTSGTIPACTQLQIGRRFDNVSYLNGHVRSIKYYPTKLTNAQLQALCRG